jgi:long-chain acyl-CoA synthetase
VGEAMSVETKDAAAAPIDYDDIDLLTRTGMLPALAARRKPEATAIHSRRGDLTFGQLNRKANQLVRALRAAGLVAGDAIAVLCNNTPEFLEVFAANLRGGFRATPVNWHLNAGEAAYVVADCEAKALIAHVDFAEAAIASHNRGVVLALAIGGEIAGFESYETVLEGQAADDIADPVLGIGMLYTSGTTGRPKGVFRKRAIPIPPQLAGTLANYDPDHDAHLLCGPGYHGGPMQVDIVTPMSSGVAIVCMEKFDPQEVLRLIDKHKVTHTHMVSTMFQRLLALPQAVKDRYDISSLKMVIHGAAPTPPQVKQAIIDWFGPIVWEYYAATEGGGNFVVGSQEWLKKPGNVGRLQPESGCRILDDEGNDVAPGVVGTIYFQNNPDAPFEYFKDPEKTRASHVGDEHFTVGDMGYIDEEGYLFLTGRTAECIISGGVNIYPQEIDNELIRHPAVRDSCTVGVPNDEWGEEVRAVISLHPGHAPSDELASELMVFARRNLAGFKTPKAVDFVDEIPRSAAGKVQRKQVREPYWADRGRQI